MAPKKAYAPLIFTDDGWIMGATEPPLTVDDLREKMVEGYAGTGGALWWAVGDHDVYHFETEVGEIFGEGYGELDPDLYSFVHGSAPELGTRIAANVRALMASGEGPLAALAGLCRQADLSFVPRVRMNSHYEIDPDHPGYSRYRREHPELLIGRPGETIPRDTVDWGIRTGLNYAFPEVRAYMAGIIFEVFEHYDVDGVELDFMRHPAFFRPEEAYAQRHLMTDLVLRVHQRLGEVSAERGRDLRLAVRVPPTIADSTRIGLDVGHWIADDLVDIVAVGGGFIPFETPVREFVAAARGTSCLVYGCIEATRYTDERNLRALAARWWRDGADGIYLYNFYTMPPEWNRRVYDQLSDPRAIARRDKIYEMDQTGPFFPCGGHSCAFRYASPSAQLPVALEEGFAGSGPILTTSIADDLDAAAAEGSLATCSLALRLDNFAPGSELRVHLNQRELPWDSARSSFDGWHREGVGDLFWMKYPLPPVDRVQPGAVVEFDLGCPPLRQGDNQVEVHLVSRATEGEEPVVLEDVAVTVAYQDGA